MRELERKIQLLKILIKNRDYQGARIEGEKLIRSYPAHVELNYLMGSIYDKLNLLKRAEEFLNNTLNLDPNHYDALVELSLFHEKNGESKEASYYRERSFRIAHKVN